ncbi:MAG: hypothetical protein ACOYKC_02875 [Anaerolineaceae bacterium]
MKIEKKISIILALFLLFGLLGAASPRATEAQSPAPRFTVLEFLSSGS